MAYADAKTQLVTMLEAVTLTDVGNGAPASLRHVPSADAMTSGSTRDFRVDAIAPAIQGGTIHPSSPRRQRVVEGEIVVGYEVLQDSDAFDRMVMSDFEAIVDYVADPSRWSRATSTIETLNLFGADSGAISPGLIEVDDDGRARLRIPFTIVYTHAAS